MAKFNDIPNNTSRFSDFISEPNQMLPPIQGYDEQPLVSLDEAVKPLESIVPQVNHMVWTVKSNCTKPKDGLSQDESASIMLYTLEWGPPEKPFYTILNENLRSRNRRQLIPWFLYLRLFIHALSKLPPSVHHIIYRGVKMDLVSGYGEGEDFVWWAFSSCTSSLRILENHIGKTGKRTIFNISCNTASNSAKDISQHSFYPEEKEVLLFPARQFKVSSSLDTGHELHIVDVKEIEPPFPLIRIPSIEKLKVKDEKLLSKTDQVINILLLGEKGVGKSTFINAFVNYLKFKTVEQAQSNHPLVLKPLSFVMMTNDTFQQKTITYGDFDYDNELVTRRCQTYTFDLNQNSKKKLCLIDTPSFEDTDQENSNTIKHILEYVNNITHLNAICFLLQPDATRLMNSFQLCFNQLLNRLGSNAQKNIIFCFTNAFMTLSMPGSTASLLRKMFASFSMNDICFNRTNTFFFENESFRYLMAVQNGIRFNNEDTSEYTMSWSDSVQESNRLLNYILTNLTPYHVVKKK
ncbi:unnamed protein product [Rotaria sp. Silwood1]|nr:unnamed protein product [Rotaria sp. Silwood1]